MFASLLIAAAIGYLLGSLPFGFLVARAKGVNIFEVGSKSSGATNVRRVLGNGPGYLVFALDALKGALASGWPLALAHARPTAADAGLIDLSFAGAMAVAGLFGALLGHSFSCFTAFRGGKGVATGAGGFAVLFPWGALIAVAAFAVVLALSRYVSLGSMVGAATLPLSAWLMHQPGLIVGVSAAVAIFVIVRHRSNISRLAAGTENKIGRAAKP
ncbi:MAG TPA: glycerol-3-phosphate 1-O-acyltransferase PlsY [Opitutaceae bacterium]|nr:glycerol-3-phosphate 1-O-acyltransferase PlsY [Opitutaceae bacterium]